MYHEKKIKQVTKPLSLQMPNVATSTPISMSAALAESQQQFDMIKRSLPQPGGVNRLMSNATVTSTRQTQQQQLLQQQLNSQAQAVHSQVGLLNVVLFCFLFFFGMDWELLFFLSDINLLHKDLVMVEIKKKRI